MRGGLRGRRRERRRERCGEEGRQGDRAVQYTNVPVWICVLFSAWESWMTWYRKCSPQPWSSLAQIAARPCWRKLGPTMLPSMQWSVAWWRSALFWRSSLRCWTKWCCEKRWRKKLGWMRVMVRWGKTPPLSFGLSVCLPVSLSLSLSLCLSVSLSLS